MSRPRRLHPFVPIGLCSRHGGDERLLGSAEIWSNA
jgi:hypothetical protein